MCGRFNADRQTLDEKFIELTGRPFPGATNHNTAPTEEAWVVREHRGELRPMAARWWLTPFWSKARSPRLGGFNARCETLSTSRVFREPFRRRRCLVPVSGFYEWRHAPGGKAPHYIRRLDAAPLLLAGVWDRWRSAANGEWQPGFAIVTAPAHAGLAGLHHRQPLMLWHRGAAAWMDHSAPIDALGPLLQPALGEDLALVPVSSYVGNARNKGPRCAEAAGPALRVAADPTPAH